MKQATMLLWLPVVLCFAVFMASPQNLLGDDKTTEKASYVGDQTCAECHEETAAAFKLTVHGSLADFQVKGKPKGCESCHGPGSIHVESGETKDIIHFADLTPDKASAACLTCHSDGSFMMWNNSQHSVNGLSCSNCHKVHQPRTSSVNAAEQMAYCQSCHIDVMAQFNYPSRHPVREGKMTCLDCHDPHGGMNGLKTVETKNDLCFTCHTDKQGPFTFEHAPVVEDCSLCHAPHGTMVNNLLTKTEPFLCLQCHHIHFQIREHLDVRGLASSACTHCHPAIHGSDLPSSLKTSGGKGLTR